MVFGCKLDKMYLRKRTWSNLKSVYKEFTERGFETNRVGQIDQLEPALSYVNENLTSLRE